MKRNALLAVIFLFFVLAQGLWPDSTPDVFTLIDQTHMPLSTAIESNPVTVSGIDEAAAVTISGGEYAISNDGGASWGAWTSSEGSVTLGQQVKVRQTSSAANSTQTTSTLAIGGVGEAFDVTTAPSGDPRASGLVAWWRGEGNAYDSVGGHHGTVHGGTTYAAGQVGQAFNFNGSSGYLSTADSDAWDLGAGDFTIEAWIRTTAPSSTMRLLAAGSHLDGPMNLWAVGYGACGPWGPGTRLNFAYYNGSGYTDLNSGAISLLTNTLYHIAVVRSGTTIFFYFNGAGAGSASIGTASLGGGSTGAIIGARYYTSPSSIIEYANGLIDELRFYNRALSADEVAELDKTVAVTSPNGGETWVTGTTQSITWTSTGSIATVDIDCSTDDGATWTGVASGEANDGSYAWTVPYAVSGQCRVRVADSGGAGTSDASDGVFSIFSDAMEPNDDPGSAAILPIGTTENLVFDGGDNANPEWFKFFVPAESAGQDLRVNVRVTSPYPDPIPYPEWASDLDFELLDGSLRVLGCTISRSDNETLYLHDVASGWYYIYVGYCTTEYADASDHARYAVTLETGTGFGLGYITGRLLDGGGYPVADEFIFLDPVPNDWTVSRPYLTSGPEGYFTIACMPGTYTILFNNAGPYICSTNYTYPSPNVVAEYFNDAKKIADATQLMLSSGQTLALADINLETGAVVTGHVTNLAAADLANVQVRSYDGGGNTFTYELVYTDAAGNYSLNSVPAGARVRFSRSGYATEFYDDKPTLGSADVQPTTPGGTLNGIDAVLGNGGTISGTVTDGVGAGIANVRVVLYSALDATYSRGYALSASDTGAYSFARVLPGDYKIFFDTTGLAYVPEWYDDTASFAAAATVSVAEGGATPGINAQLAPYSITVTSPNGGESWIPTTSHDITWTSTGTIANVNIEYSTDGGTTWTDVVVSTPNDGSYSWTIPDTPSANCTICISDSANPPIADYSDALFTISAASTPSIAVTSPNGGETWVTGTSENIIWTSTGTIANVVIEFSQNNGIDWIPVDTVANTGSYFTEIPYFYSTQCLVRVSDAADAGVFDASDGVFSIFSDAMEPNDDPGSAAILPIGTTENLVFDGGDNANPEWFKFFVPAESAGQDLRVNVRVTSPYPDPIPYPEWASDLDFELLDGSLRVLGCAISRSDNETLYLHNVASGWYYINVGYCTTEYADASDHARYAVTLETGTGFGLGYITGRLIDGGGDPVADEFIFLDPIASDWTVSRPYLTSGTDGTFCVAFLPGSYTLLFNNAGKYICAANFTYPSPNVVAEYYSDKKTAATADTLTFAAGQTLALGDIALETGAVVNGHVTNLAAADLANVQVRSYDGGGNTFTYELVYTDAAGNYSLNSVPAGARVRFSRSGYATEFYDDKPTLGSADVQPTTPGGTLNGIDAVLGNGGTISGTVTDGVGAGIANVRVVLYSVLDATYSRGYALSASDTGAFSFARVLPGDYKIFFDTTGLAYVPEWYDDAASFAAAATVSVAEGGTTSGLIAQLAPYSITVTSPNGGESWLSGTSQDITWNTTSGVGNVDILYSYDGGSNWTSIAADTANDGSHPWTVPDTPSGNCYVQVLEHADGSPWDSSDAAFTIVSQPISVTISGTILHNSSPLSGVVMSGLPGNPVTNGSGFYTSAVDYDWSGTVTPTLAGYAFTPASRTYSNVTSDQSSQDYTAALAPSLQLTCPNGWEHWTLGSTKTITWNAVNYTGTVRLVLFKAGVRFGNIVANLPATAGSYTWTVGLTYDNGMAPEGGDYRLYLRSTDGTLIDPSDYRLALIDPAQLEVTAPNGGESWELGTTQNITWNANGYAGTVRLILFQKGAKIGQIVGSLPAGQGSYAWTVGVHQAGVAPAGILYSIRVLAGDGSQDDFSDGPLTLIENDALILDHQHTSINTIPSQWLDQAAREKLLVLSAQSNDLVTLGLRLLGGKNSRLAPADSYNSLGLVLSESSWLPQGVNLDLQEWQWALEKAILDSQATVVVIRPDEGALLAGRLNAESYLSVLNELASRLPGVKLVCSTVAMDESNEQLAKFNRQVRESVLVSKGILFDAADIESWRAGEQHLVNEVPLRYPSYRSQGVASEEDLGRQGAAAWWLLARLSGWPGPQPETAE